MLSLPVLKMAHNNLAPSVNCSLDDIDLNALKVIMLFTLNICYNYFQGLYVQYPKDGIGLLLDRIVPTLYVQVSYAMG